MNRITRLLAVTGISGVLALGVAGVAQASPDHGVQGSKDQVSKVDRSSRDHGKRDHSRHDKSRDGKKHERTSRS